MKKIQNSYKKSGVNISLANKLVKHISSISKKTENKPALKENPCRPRSKSDSARPLFNSPHISISQGQQRRFDICVLVKEIFVRKLSKMKDFAVRI